MAFPKTISTEKLELKDLPTREARWKNMAAFALTFDPGEIGEYGQEGADLNNASSKSTLSELRAHLYIEQRRWNHFGQEPDESTMKKLRNIIGIIRQKLGDSSQ